MHFEHAAGKIDFLRGRVLHIFQLDEFQAIANRFLAHIVLANHPQSHIEAMAGDVVDEVESFQIVGEAVPIDFVGDRLAADLFDLFHAGRKCRVLELLDLSPLVESHGGVS